MSAIILPGNPTSHHDLLPDILSQSITYILSINLPRVELRSHLAAALHAVPPGMAHQYQHNIRVTLHHLDQQPPPRRHHQELVQYLRYHLREHRAFVGHASLTPEDIYMLLATACHQYIEQLPPRHPTRAVGHQAPRPRIVYDITGEELTSHIEYDIGNEEQEENESIQSTHHHVPRHRVVYNTFGQPHLECLDSISEEEWDHHW